MAVITDFTRVEPIAEEVLREYEGAIPEGFLELWRTHGTGLVSDGLVRLVDPSSLQDVLPFVIEDPEDCVPVLTTAMADLVVFRDGYLFVIDSRMAAAKAFPVIRPETMVRLLNSPGYLAGKLRSENYALAVERLGVPTLDECFYYAPLLSLGGAESADSLRRGGLVAHIEMAASIQGKIEIGAPEGGPRLKRT